MGLVSRIVKIILPLVIIAGLLFYFGQGLQDVSLDKFTLSGISDIGTSSFTLDGDLFVKNPSDVSIPIKEISYDVVLKETGEVIGSGVLPTFTLSSDTTSQIPFNQEVNWVPTLRLATELATKEQVLVEVNGIAIINLPKVDEYELPFSQETDIKEYMVQFVPNPVNEIVSEPIINSPTDIVNNENTDSSDDSDSSLNNVLSSIG